LEAIKKSMIADSSFSKKDNDYLQTKYEEYKKVIKKESEDKTKWEEFKNEKFKLFKQKLDPPKSL